MGFFTRYGKVEQNWLNIKYLLLLFPVTQIYGYCVNIICNGLQKQRVDWFTLQLIAELIIVDLMISVLVFQRFCGIHEILPVNRISNE